MLRKLLLTLLILVALTACSNTFTTVPASSDEKVSAQTILPKTATQPLKGLTVHFIDIGQGDSIYLRTAKGDDILIDGGDKSKGDEVVAYLKKIGVKDIDILISSHPDADHIGGLDEVLYAFPVKRVYAPKVSHNTQAFEQFLLAVKKEGVKIQTVKAGVFLPLQDKTVSASFLAPTKDYGKDLNNWSAVLQVTKGNQTFLLTGDAEIESEQDMLALKKLKKVDVLKVSHHGADSGTSQAFLNVIKPTFAFISAGKNNRYDHPRQETLSRLAKIGAKVYRTDKQGNIVVTSDGKDIHIQTQR